jgi:hypothetical protein
VAVEAAAAVVLVGAAAAVVFVGAATAAVVLVGAGNGVAVGSAPQADRKTAPTMSNPANEVLRFIITFLQCIDLLRRLSHLAHEKIHPTL